MMSEERIEIFVVRSADGGDATSRIQSAIDECFSRGGGRVVLKAGEYRISGVRVRSNVFLVLQSGVVVKGSRDPESYFGWRKDKLQPVRGGIITDVLWSRASNDRNNDFIIKAGSRWNNAVFRFIDAENAGIIGEKGAVIDGCDCYDEKGEEHYRGPHGVNVHHCKNLLFSGYTIRNAGNWAHAVYFSNNVKFDNLVVEAGHDGVHLSSCDNIEVKNCEFFTGDDCVAGFDNENVVIRSCTFNTACSGLRFGGKNVLVEYCLFQGPAKHFFRGSLSLEDKIQGNPAPVSGRKNMLSAFTYYADFTLDVRHIPSDIVLRRCSVENVDRFLHYNFSGNERWQLGKPLGSIRFEKIRAKGLGMSLCAYGSPSLPLSLEIIDSSFAFAGVEEFIRACNYRDIKLSDVVVSGVKGPLVRTWGGDGDLSVVNFKGEGIKADKVDADKPFDCAPV